MVNYLTVSLGIYIMSGLYINTLSPCTSVCYIGIQSVAVLQYICVKLNLSEKISHLATRITGMADTVFGNLQEFQPHSETICGSRTRNHSSRLDVDPQVWDTCFQSLLMHIPNGWMLTSCRQSHPQRPLRLSVLANTWTSLCYCQGKQFTLYE